MSGPYIQPANSLERYLTCVASDNKYGMGTSVERASAKTEYYERGQYIPGIRVDGMDVLAVMSLVKYARDLIINGANGHRGPIVAEFVTYRFAGHSMSDPGIIYRTREEIQEKRKQDPISVLKSRLIEMGINTEDELRKIDKEVRSFIGEEVAAAEKMDDPPPTPSTLYQDIYVRGSEPESIRGRSVHETHYHR